MAKRDLMIKIMKDARDVILEPGSWCVGFYAKDANGENVESNSPLACQWCSSGALRRALRMNEFSSLHNIFYDIVDILSEAMGGEDIITFNDSSSHGEVLSAWDEAIKSLEFKEHAINPWC